MTSKVAVAAAIIRLGIAEIEARLGRDKATIWRWYTAGKFPAPHYIGERRAWFLHEIEAWEREQMARPAEARRRGRGLRNVTTGTEPPRVA